MLLLCGAIGWYLKGKLTPQMPGLSAMGGGEPSVLVQKITASNISPQAAYIAHVEPIKSVDLKPQVAGYIEKVLFEEGSQVNEGDVLFVIEQEKYKATVSLREAELDAAKANLVKMERDYKRQVSLSKQNIASKATFDNAESNYLQAKAAVKQAEANLDLAKIDLDYTEIKAPFSGYIGKALVREGNYVSSNSTSLARIVQVNPIRVAFSMTDKDFLNIRQEYKNEKMPISGRNWFCRTEKLCRIILCPVLMTMRLILIRRRLRFMPNLTMMKGIWYRETMSRL